MSLLPYGRQDVDEADVAAVVDVLRSDRLTQGPAVDAFEQAVAKRCEVAHAVAVSSASAGLQLACQALDVGPGDTVWTTPITFVASANAAVACGADVDFIDIDPVTWNLCPSALAERLAAERERGGALPKVVIVVHFAGEPCDMQAIAALADEYGFVVVEDAAHAFGSRSGAMPVGACQHSSITVFSFHPVKIITAGEGGMLMTQDPVIDDRLRALRTGGIWRTDRVSGSALAEPWAYEQHELGGNYRLSDIHASLGLSQLSRVDRFIERRQQLAARYDSLLADSGLTLPYRSQDSFSALHLYPVLIPADAGGNPARQAVFQRMVQAGIGVNVHYIPVHTQPFYRDRLGERSLPYAEAYYAQALSLPLFGVMTVEDQDRVVAALFDALDVSSPLRRAA